MVVGRTQGDVVGLDVDILYGKFAVEDAHGHVAAVYLHALVDHEDVALVHVGVHHAVAHHAGIEGALGVLHEVAVQVDGVFHIVLRRRGETGTHALVGKG